MCLGLGADGHESKKGFMYKKQGTGIILQSCAEFAEVAGLAMPADELQVARPVRVSVHLW